MKQRTYTPANVLATLYRHLGIDPAVTLPDHLGRPMCWWRVEPAREEQ